MRFDKKSTLLDLGKYVARFDIQEGQEENLDFFVREVDKNSSKVYFTAEGEKKYGEEVLEASAKAIKNLLSLNQVYGFEFEDVVQKMVELYPIEEVEK